jgi:hypothetical protein
MLVLLVRYDGGPQGRGEGRSQEVAHANLGRRHLPAGACAVCPLCRGRAHTGLRIVVLLIMNFGTGEQSTITHTA